MHTTAVYERARLARDRRFDGHFFVGVLTTGIYCRPICPANVPKPENVRFFQSAAAAAEAGFRPCLRCRPECAPGSPAWGGTSTTVRRGLRLIANGALDGGSVEQLAERLGVTSRHLRRLFTEHIGASPLAVAHTQRLHFAKRLIDETSLPLHRVADAAGYRSLRRFNDTFQKTYGRSPRALRHIDEDTATRDGSATLSVRLPYREPLDWQALLAFFAQRAVPGVERVDGDRYLRALSVDARPAVVEVRPDKTPGYLLLTFQDVSTTALFETVQRAREVFDLDAPVSEIAEALRSDPMLQGALARHPGIRVPGAWSGFELTVRAVLGQQVSVKAATTLAGRLTAQYGEPLDATLAEKTGVRWVFPAPDRLVRARFKNIGLVQSRAQTLRAVASAVVSGALDFESGAEPEAICRQLTSIKGIGEWTAQYVAMRALKNPDALPAGDLGLQKALGSPGRETEKNLLRRAERWRPWRAYAALLLWQQPSASGG